MNSSFGRTGKKIVVKSEFYIVPLSLIATMYTFWTSAMGAIKCYFLKLNLTVLPKMKTGFKKNSNQGGHIPAKIKFPVFSLC